MIFRAHSGGAGTAPFLKLSSMAFYACKSIVNLFIKFNFYGMLKGNLNFIFAEKNKKHKNDDGVLIFHFTLLFYFIIISGGRG